MYKNNNVCSVMCVGGARWMPSIGLAYTVIGKWIPVEVGAVLKKEVTESTKGNFKSFLNAGC